MPIMPFVRTVCAFSAAFVLTAQGRPALGQSTQRAGAAPLTVRIERVARLAPGRRAFVRVRVRGSIEHPLMVTPIAEGNAIRVARGRLLRAEGQPEAESLVFRIPIFAQRTGSAVLRVRVDGYACRLGQPRAPSRQPGLPTMCRAAQAEATTVVAVGIAPPEAPLRSRKRR